ncbi:MAG: hypothetical protein R3D69_06395 [Xanthobacteraceae bacterium]
MIAGTLNLSGGFVMRAEKSATRCWRGIVDMVARAQRGHRAGAYPAAR